MAAAKTVQVLVIGDSRSAQAALKAVSGEAAITEGKLATLGAKMQTWGRSMSSVGSTLTRRVTLPLVLVGGGMVKLAADAGETRNKVGEIFGGMADDIESWSDTAIEDMGLAQATAQNMASEFGLLFQAAKLPGPEVVGLSEDFTQLAADMSSFFNVGAEDALMALRSGLTGEAEPLRRFGVFLSEAAVEQEAFKMGVIEAGEALTDQQKVVVRAAIIQESLTKASGDYARTAGSVTNRARALTEKFKEMGADLGQKLLPLAEKLLTWASDMLDKFNALSPGTQEMILKIGGVTAVMGPLLRIFGPFVSLLGKTAGWLPKIVPWLVKWGAIRSFPVPVAPVMPVGTPTGAVPVAGGLPAAPSGTGLPTGVLGLLALGTFAGASTTRQLRDMEAIEEVLARTGDTAEDVARSIAILTNSFAESGSATQVNARAFRAAAAEGLTYEAALDALGITQEVTTGKMRRWADEVGASESALKAYLDVMGDSQELTKEESKAIAGLISLLDRNGRELTKLETQQLKNLAVMGDYAAIQQRLNDLIERSIAPIKNYVRWQDTLEGAIAATSKAAYAAYQNQLLLNGATSGGGGGGGGGNGGGGSSSGGGHRVAVEPRRFSRDLDYVRIASH